MNTVRKHVVTEDESGLRLDRWFKRRYPTLALSHLNKIVRKGEVRVDGKRVETATRLEAGATIRVPPLDLAAAPAKPAAKTSPRDAQALRDMTLFEDKRCARPQQALRSRRAGRLRHDAPYRRHARLPRGCRRQPARAGASARPRYVRRAARREIAAASRRNWAKPFAPGRRRKSTGPSSRGCQNRRRAASRCSSPKARAWATSAASGEPRARPPGATSSGCASPRMATRTRSIRSPIMPSSTRWRRAAHGSR